MKVYREDTSDLQLLIETLQIDPELISVDVIKNTKPIEVSEPIQKSASNEIESEPKEEKDTTNCEHMTSAGANESSNDNTAQNSKANDESTNTSDDSKKIIKDPPILEHSRKRKISSSEGKSGEGESSTSDEKEVKISKSDNKDR